MPLTFSHPAAILPLKRLCPRWLSFPALVMGTMLPDLGYFLFLFERSELAHSLWGSLVWDLPIGMLIVTSFWIYRVEQWEWRRAIRDFSRYAVSIWLGTLSHIVWDSFTHQRGIFGEIPLLNANTIKVFGDAVPLYKILQHASTAFGLIALFLFAWRNRRGWLREQVRAYWRPALAGIPLATSIAIFSVYGIRQLETALLYFVVYFTDCFALVILATAALKHRQFKKSS